MPSELQQLVVATHNSHKTEEIAAIVQDFFAPVVDLTGYPELPEPVEDGDTFEANSAIKALSASSRLPGAMVLADDSGLEVDALNGAPGVYSARYAGEAASDRDNRVKLISELAAAGAKGKQRSCRFRCVLTLAQGDETIAVFDGACEGIIANEEKGEGGFGYDSLFIPDGYCETFGQLSAEIKNQLSHRACALEKFLAWLVDNPLR